MKKIKISELPLVSSLVGLFTIGTDSQNRSVKVSLEFVKTSADNADAAALRANQKAGEANTAATNANTKAGLAQAAADNANGKATLAQEKATLAETKAGEAAAAAQEANSKAALAQAKAELADTKAGLANDAATEASDWALRAQEATIDAIEATRAIIQTTPPPTSMSVTYPKRITLGNLSELFVRAILAPVGVLQNVIYITDRRSVDVAPNGRISVLEKGIGTVHIIPTQNTALYRSVTIEVAAPDCRLSTLSTLRLTSGGAFRLT